jgi:hypothetical protein
MLVTDVLLHFRKYFKTIGRAYTARSIALINLSRHLAESSSDPDNDADLQTYCSLFHDP